MEATEQGLVKGFTALCGICRVSEWHKTDDKKEVKHKDCGSLNGTKSPKMILGEHHIFEMCT